MSEPTQESEDRGWGTYTFVCPRCATSLVISLKATNRALRCRCGAPLSRTAQLGSTPGTPER